jgi:hypothetical protein
MLCQRQLADTMQTMLANFSDSLTADNAAVPRGQ